MTDQSADQRVEDIRKRAEQLTPKEPDQVELDREFLLSQLDEGRNELLLMSESLLTFEAGRIKDEERIGRLVALVQECLSHCSPSRLGYDEYNDLAARAAQELGQ